MTSIGRVTGAIFVLFVGLHGTTSARAAEASKVETLIHEGIALRQQGRDGPALLLFQAAYERERTARTAAQLGLCEMSLGYWIAAEAHLSESLAAPGNPWVEKNRATLSDSLERVRDNIGELALVGAPAGALLVVDGKDVARLPLPAALRLGKGPHDVEVRGDGKGPWTRSVVILGRDKPSIAVELVDRTSVPAPAARAVPGAMPEGSPPGPPAPKSVGAAPGGGPRRILGWSAVGIAALGLGLGTLETVKWIQASREFDDHTVALLSDATRRVQDCGEADVGFGGDECGKIHSRLETARLFTFIGYGVAAAAGATAVILLATSPRDTTKTESAFSCGADLFARSASCSISF
jgi:hypothetical protein